MVLDPRAEVRHLAAIGVTGSGKSTALRALMYTALRRGDRHVVADPDGSAMRLFHAAGDVILNPFDARSAKWDILAEIREDTDYRFLTESVLPFSKGGDDNEWIKYAREIFAACLRSWHENRIGSSDAFFATVATADREKLATLCEGSAAHRYFEAGNEKMLGSILGTMGPALESMRQLARLAGPPFSVRSWLREGRGSLWMPYQARQIRRCAGWCRAGWGWRSPRRWRWTTARRGGCGSTSTSSTRWGASRTSRTRRRGCARRAAAW